MAVFPRPLHNVPLAGAAGRIRDQRHGGGRKPIFHVLQIRHFAELRWVCKFGPRGGDGGLLSQYLQLRAKLCDFEK